MAGVWRHAEVVELGLGLVCVVVTTGAVAACGWAAGPAVGRLLSAAPCLLALIVVMRAMARVRRRMRAGGHLRAAACRDGSMGREVPVPLSPPCGCLQPHRSNVCSDREARGKYLRGECLNTRCPEKGTPPRLQQPGLWPSPPDDMGRAFLLSAPGLRVSKERTRNQSHMPGGTGVVRRHPPTPVPSGGQRRG